MRIVQLSAAAVLAALLNWPTVTALADRLPPVHYTVNAGLLLAGILLGRGIRGRAPATGTSSRTVEGAPS